MPKSDRNAVITHDELIALAREYRQARDISPEQQNALLNRWECKFKNAIGQARTMGILAVDLLKDLRDLTDPSSGENICPFILQRHLNKMIAHLTAAEPKNERARLARQIVEVET